MSSPPTRRITRSSTRNQPDQPRRSTRQAALDANIRIIEEQERRQKRKTKGRSRSSSPTARPGRDKDHPIELLDDRNDSKQHTSSSSPSATFHDFTCPICLDRPSSPADLAAIGGCVHKFCFDCIDTWAKTENTCPCCKSRFRRIERVVPSKAVRRDKRKRGGISGGDDANSQRRRATERVNFRVVEDRNQPSGPVMNTAFIEQMLEQFASVSREHGGNVMTGVFSGNGMGGPTFRFSNVGGNPIMRIERPGGNGAHMEFFLAEVEGEGGRPGRGRVRYLRDGGVPFPPLDVNDPGTPPPGDPPGRRSSPRRRNSDSAAGAVAHAGAADSLPRAPQRITISLNVGGGTNTASPPAAATLNSANRFNDQADASETTGGDPSNAATSTNQSVNSSSWTLGGFLARNRGTVFGNGATSPRHAARPSPTSGRRARSRPGGWSPTPRRSRRLRSSVDPDSNNTSR